MKSLVHHKCKTQRMGRNRDFGKVTASRHFKEIAAKVQNALGSREKLLLVKIPRVPVCLRISMKLFLVSFYLKCLSHNSDRKTSDTETNSNGLGLRSKPSKLFSSLNS